MIKIPVCLELVNWLNKTHKDSFLRTIIMLVAEIMFLQVRVYHRNGVVKESSLMVHVCSQTSRIKPYCLQHRSRFILWIWTNAVSELWLYTNSLILLCPCICLSSQNTRQIIYASLISQYVFLLVLITERFFIPFTFSHNGQMKKSNHLLFKFDEFFSFFLFFLFFFCYCTSYSQKNITQIWRLRQISYIYFF